MLTVEVRSESAQRLLNRVVHALADPGDAMKSIANILDRSVQRNFDAEGQPAKWAPLKPSTLKAAIRPSAAGRSKGRGRRRAAPGQAHKILQSSGELRRSITAKSGRDYAQVGSALVYSRIHQFGGKAGRGLKVTIPARPFLGRSDTPGEMDLSDEDWKNIEGAMERHLHQAAT